MKSMRTGSHNLALISCVWLLSCTSAQNPVSRESRAAELEVSEEDANAAINEATADDSAPIEAGDEASFLNAEEAKENFINESAEVRDDMFGNESDEAAMANAVDPDFPVDPTAASPMGENLAQESMTQDPTAMINSNPTAPDAMQADDGDPVAAAAAAESAAMSTAAGDIDPIGEGSDQIPPALMEDSSVATAPTAPPPSVPAAPAAAPAPTQPAPVEEVEPVSSVLSWVGYRIAEKDRQLKVELFSQGNPDFEIFEETNRAQQLELVIRYYQTRLRRKIHWDINSSEFRSPVAYIRMREFKDKGVVDVVLTHRDAVLPEFYARDGRMLLVYKIPETYFNSTQANRRMIKDRAISLVTGIEAPLRQASKPSSTNGPEQLGHRRTIFRDEPTALRPIKDVIRSFREEEADEKGLPDDFNRRPAPKQQRAVYQIETFSLSSVGQDDLNESVEEEEDDSSSAFDALKRRKANEAAGEASSNAVQNVPTETVESNPVPAPAAEAPAANALPVVNEAVPAESFPMEEEGPLPAAETPDPAADISITDEAVAEPTPPPAPPPPPEPVAQPTQAGSVMSNPIEMTGQANPNGGQAYTGKPVFMEFYDAPLSLVLKSFSEETGNNFVYSSAIGSTPVTVHFKGVPWDEALKGILETYSLGMVRIGESVVRIDQVTRLTQYMQDLEQAKLFEMRRIPTKVLVFRVNNAVAKDVTQRLQALLARDIEVDQRTKIQADDRTNSIVMEASLQVLNKAKAIIERLDLETPQVEIASRIVEVQKTMNNFFGVAWGNSFNFDPGRALGFGSLNFPNSVGSSFAVDPGVAAANTAGVGRFRFGSLNKFVDLDLLLKMEEKKGTTNVLQSNRVLVLDGQKASILAGNSRFFRPAAGAATIPGQVPAGGGAGGGEAVGLAEVKFNLQLDVKPQITALGSVIMDLLIKSDTPGDSTGEALATKNTRELTTQMVRDSGDTGVIGGIYDTSRTTSVSGVPLLSDIPILGALFRSTQTVENQTELLIMVTPTIVSGRNTEDRMETSATKGNRAREAM
ncbi:MAG TPA: secretin N-terminal domain-containing protein [Oligoflexus sp.]|uniref:secretin N-terminal domain-containing protein n=1 Tax=Oligoflexus sp. TaxID=1971216 RepID=UPI002D802B5C|nr:secretin N-terminal domain-containing protein [Oligoflexus sp.]HET9239962.1 secretin N-terminal domain-containing protein [Oligoflexus sp.]